MKLHALIFLLTVVFSAVSAASTAGANDHHDNNDAAPPPPNQARGGHGRASQAPRFSQQEKLSLVDTIFRLLPIGPDAWEQVANEHNALWHTNRSDDSCRRQFAKLHKTKMPTGDPHCPPEVKAAKRAKQRIREKAEMGEGNSDVSGFEEDQEDEFGENEPPHIAAVNATANAATNNEQEAAGNGFDPSVIEMLGLPHFDEPPPRARQVHQGANVARRPARDAHSSEKSPGFASEPLFPQGVIPQPLPVGYGNPKKKGKSPNTIDSILQLCQMQVLQSMAQSAADLKNSKDEKEEREKERQENRREQRRMDERFMQMMMLMMAGIVPHDGDKKKSGKRKRDSDYGDASNSD